MKNSEKVKIYLNIGDQHISLNVQSDRQEFVRGIESEVNELFLKWRRSFPAKSDREIFAMVAYQYASFYGELKELYEAATEKAAECLESIGDVPSTEDEEESED